MNRRCWSQNFSHSSINISDAASDKMHASSCGSAFYLFSDTYIFLLHRGVVRLNVLRDMRYSETLVTGTVEYKERSNNCDGI